MSSVTLIFPHQLFKEHPALAKGREVYLVEYDLFFGQYKFHKQKLILHRASMKYYAQYLSAKGYLVHYIEHRQPRADLSILIKELGGKGTGKIVYADTVDYLLERRLRRYANKYAIALDKLESPNFILSHAENEQYFADNKFFLTEYYIHTRKKLNVLLDGDKPLGGRWTFDSDNRKKIPKGTTIPTLKPATASSFLAEAKTYINSHFAANYGKADKFVYPTTHTDAEEWLDTFLTQRFNNYGVYQDAIVQNENWLFHSILTPMLNVGLLSPMDVVDKAIEYSEKHNIPVNSLEGFVRQVLGWREYIRAVYEIKGTGQRTRNYWQHTNKIPIAFYSGKTGIAPVDDAIAALQATGYNHHIQRLMILGNFMLLCEFNPDEVYEWFMTMYIDSYDWVMVPNVYGMSQYADGGLMSTKPYISGSNYVLKMSNYPKGSWCETWDALFWRFIHKHYNAFAKNPRMSMMAVQVAKMDKQKLETHLKTAENFLNTLTGKQKL